MSAEPERWTGKPKNYASEAARFRDKPFLLCGCGKFICLGSTMIEPLDQDVGTCDFRTFRTTRTHERGGSCAKTETHEVKRRTPQETMATFEDAGRRTAIADLRRMAKSGLTIQEALAAMENEEKPS